MTGTVHIRIPRLPDHGWMRYAACTPDPKWTPESKPKFAVLDELRAICQTCPVLRDCARYAVDENVHGGIYAGIWVPSRACPEWLRARDALWRKTWPLHTPPEG